MELLSEMKQCKTVAECHACATIDANGEDEAAAGWLTCIEEMFGKLEHITVLGNEVMGVITYFPQNRISSLVPCNHVLTR